MDKKYENQGVKRKFDEEEEGEFSSASSSRKFGSKRWKSTSPDHVRQQQSETSSSFPNRKQTSFANDRLKRLRNNLKADVVPISSVANTALLNENSRNRKQELQTKPFNFPNSVKFVPNSNCSEVVRFPLVQDYSISVTKYKVRTVDAGNHSIRVSVPNDKLNNSFGTNSSYNNAQLETSVPTDADTYENRNFANSRLSKLRININNKCDTRNQTNGLSHLNTIAFSTQTSKCDDFYKPDPQKALMIEGSTDQSTQNKDYDTSRQDTGFIVENPMNSNATHGNYSSMIKGMTSQNNKRYLAEEDAQSSKQSIPENNFNLVSQMNTKSHDSNNIERKERNEEKISNAKIITSRLESVQNPSNSCKNYSDIVDSLFDKYFNGQNESDGLEENTMDWQDYFVEETSNDNRLQENNAKELYLIVDTNVFIHNLDILKNIINNSKGKIKPVIYLPWMVISELDFIKDDSKSSGQLKSKVQEAVRFINENILGGKKTIKGQTIHEAEQQKHVGKSPDDKIVACCLQVRETYKNTIFVSNDCLLRNKILINGIPALSTNELMKPSNPSRKTQKLEEKIVKILEEMSTCCSFIICECAREAYGKVWNKMAMLNNPPWSLKICLKIFKKYWRGIFQEKFLKQFMQSVEKLEEAMRAIESEKTWDIFNRFVESYLGLCFYFKDLEEHKEFIENSIKDVKSIAYIN